MLLLLATAACNEPSAGLASSASAPEGGAAAPLAATEESPALRALAAEYRGTIGAAAIVARLSRDHGRVTGSYFVESTGSAVILAGQASGAHLVLEETADRAKHGALALDLAPDEKLTGSWTDANGGASTPVALVPIPLVQQPSSALVLKRMASTSKPVIDAKDGACKAALSYPEVFGLPATVEAKLNADLAPPPEFNLPERCDHPSSVEADYRVAHNADGVLSVRLTTSFHDGETTTRKGRVVNAFLATGLPVKLFGAIVKPKAERTFESAVNQQIVSATQRHRLDAAGRKALDEALAFSPPFVVEDTGVRLFPDAIPAAYAAVAAEGVLVSYATIPRPAGPLRTLWGK